MKKILSCYIFTETTLGVQCAKHWLNSGHNLLGIVSTNYKIQQWSENNNIVCYHSIESFKSQKIISKSFDFLFSIVNYAKLPKSILDLPLYCSINYHDSILPKYAGVHATSWAILNGESTHGVSWHIMSDIIDAGNILKQSTFPIDLKETAFGLNLKCYTHAANIFKELVNDLDNGNVIGKKQNLVNRTYFSLHKKPSNFGFVDWNLAAYEIDRIHRALSFGEGYQNMLATFKVIIGKNFYIPKDIKVMSINSDSYPGSIIKIDNNEIQIVTNTTDILLSNFVSLSNKRYSVQEISAAEKISVSDQLVSPSNDLISFFSKYSELISQSERFWKRELNSIVKPQLLSVNLCCEGEFFNLFTQNIDFNLLEDDNVKYTDILVASFIFYLSYIENINSISLGFITSFLDKLPNEVIKLFPEYVPLTFNIKKGLKAKNILEDLKIIIKELEKNGGYLQDVFARFTDLKFDSSELPILINIGDFSNIRTSLSGVSLVFNINEEQRSFSIYIRDNTNKVIKNLFDQSPEHIVNLSRQIIKLSNKPLDNLSILTNKEKKTLYEWNATDKGYPREKTIHGLFEEQVEKTPDSIAVVYEDKQLTYQQLNKRANQLAHYLIRNHDIKPDTLIVLCLDRSEYMLIAILAVLKAGGAYVSMDPSYPDDRIKYVLEDCGTGIVITDKIYQQRIVEISKVYVTDLKYTKKASQRIEVLAINADPLQEQVSLQLVINPVTKATNKNIAYVIYTSGTTGNPKGVLQVHSNIMRLFTATDEWYKFSNKDIWTMFHSYVFDFTIWEIWGALIYGGKLVIPSYEQTRDPNIFYELCKQEQVTVLNQTPNAFYQFINLAIIKGIQDKLTSLRYVIFGGEALNLSQLRSWFDYYGYKQPKLINMYGITETTVHATYKPIEKQDLSENSYIGKMIPDLKGYVLNDDLKPLPIGAIGELYIGGVGLARGYLNRPELTAEKFIANPFRTKEDVKEGKNSRLYKTGDLVRWLPDGNIEYIGRNDFQVKIRGYRIELGEIENVLASYEGIKQSVVLAKEHQNDGKSSGGKYLVGYYVSDEELDNDKIRSYMGSRLPEYMVPSFFMFLEKMPLTINGKLDRKSLPDPEFTSVATYVAPRNALEKQMCKIWSEVLGLSEDKVGVEDDFFKLGGDSIVSIQLASRFRQNLKLHINVKDIFQYKTIAKLYDNVITNDLARNSKVAIKSEQGKLSGVVRLLPVQEWFFINKFLQSNHWNQSFLVKVGNIELTNLQDAVDRLVEYHDAFSLRYKQKNNRYIQYYDSSAVTYKIKTLDIRTLKSIEGDGDFTKELAIILTSWQSEFSLEDGPTYSIGYIYGYEDGTARIYFALHHLIVDTVSWRIITEDLKNLYEGNKLAKKGSSYRQWCDAVREYGENNKDENEYWQNVVIDYEDNTSELNKLVVSEDTNNHSSIQLNSLETKRLIQESNITYHTEINDILLTSLSYALSDLTGNKTHHITLEGHGREEIDSKIDITKTVGWFTTMYPVRLEIKDNIGSSIKNIKATLRNIPSKGIGYGVCVGYQGKSLPRISFNYLGQFNKDDNQQASWSITNESSGIPIDSKNIDYNIININGMVIDNKLQFDIASKLSEFNTNRLAELFQNRLQEIINHTISQDRSYLTTSDISNIISQEELDRLQKDKEIESVYLANSLQQGFIYHSLSQGDVDDAYIVQMMWRYNDSLDIERLCQAWEYAQAKYGSLRLRFAWQEELVQIIDKKGEINWIYIDLSCEEEERQGIKIREIQELDRTKSYKLDEGNLFRIYLIKQKDNLYTCILSNHHTILDGWSVPLLLNYVHSTYLKLVNNETVRIKIDYSYEYAQKYLQEHKDDNAEYWNNYVEQIEEKNDLSGLLSEEAKNSNVKINEYKHIKESKNQVLKIKDDLYSCLKELSQKQGVTINSILQYVWHKVLSIYGNNNQTIVGTIVSGRNIPVDNIETSVGLFINTLPVILNHSKSLIEEKHSEVIELIKEIQNSINEANVRSNISLARIQEEGKRLFDSLFLYMNYPVQIENKPKLSIEFIEKLDYPLTVIVHESNPILTFTIKYAEELLSKDKIKHLLSITQMLLEQIGGNNNYITSRLNYLPPEQYHKIINEWNATDKEYPEEKTIHGLFEEQVEKTPDSIAVVYEGKQLSYRELNNRANQLAHYLKQTYNISPNKLVALCLDRSEYMLIAILAVLKADGAYVPIDPSYSEERIKFILKDASTEVLITNIVYEAKLQKLTKDVSIANDKNTIGFINKILSIELIDNINQEKLLSNQPISNICSITTSNNLAYVIYTSGTTGKPKGVLIEHKGVSNSSYATILHREILFNSRVLHVAPYIFDSSILEIFPTLFTGASLFIVNETIRKDIFLIHKYCLDYKITNLFLTTKYAEAFLKFDNNELCLINLAIAGEMLNTVKASKFIIINEYGPTENTVCTTKIRIVNYNKFIPIGSPIFNVKCYILNDYLNPLPIGAIGELYIGGIGLARGYLNRPELTAEKFIANPFRTKEDVKESKNSRLYKTGDLVRWLPDGNIEYIGRNDFQVKIRGYRIELGEIENVLASYEGIKQSVVLAKEHQNDSKSSRGKYLVGYYVSDEELDNDKIRLYMESKLPEYMVPSILVHLEKLPLTINGKLDRKSLPDPEFTSIATYVAPRNALEKQMCKIWSEVLGLAEGKVGVEDSFFKLGGDSILAIKLVNSIVSKLNAKLDIKSIVQNKTIATLSKNLEFNNTFINTQGESYEF